MSVRSAERVVTYLEDIRLKRGEQMKPAGLLFVFDDGTNFGVEFDEDLELRELAQILERVAKELKDCTQSVVA